MFWIIYVIIMAIDLLLVKLTAKLDSGVFTKDQGGTFFSILSVLCPFIPVFNWIFLIFLLILLLSSIDWIDIAEEFYKVKKK